MPDHGDHDAAISAFTLAGIRNVSLHVWFDNDLAAFRFVMRVGAVPWWAAAVTQKNGGGTVSSAVALEAR